jgi:hypothetical protein
VREDRLTDFVALAAQRNLTFARALLALAGLRQPITHAVALTQAWTPRGRRVDLEIIGMHQGRTACRMWAEHKTGAAYQDLQLEDYAQDLATTSNARLLTVVEHPAQAPVSPTGAWTAVTWADIAAEAVGILRNELGPEWRRRSWAPETSARLLVLAELLEYLNEEHKVVSDPLTSTDLIAFANSASAYHTLTALLARVGQLSEEPLSGDVGWLDDGASGWLGLEPRPEDWWTAYDGYPEVHLADADLYFGAERRGEPAFGLGINLVATATPS